MEKAEILHKMDAELHALVKTLSGTTDIEFFRQGADNKWSIAQNAEHLILAVRPLNLAFSLPRFTWKIFGKPKRTSSSYEELVQRYQQRLKDGARASRPFIPARQAGDRAGLIGRLVDSYDKFRLNTLAIPEDALDQYQLPHPILGKITLREMLFFTAYHIHHHHRIVKERLSH